MLGHAYRNARVNRSLSLREVCDDLGVTYVHLSEIERAIRLPTVDEDLAWREVVGIRSHSDECRLLASLYSLAGGYEAA